MATRSSSRAHRADRGAGWLEQRDHHRGPAREVREVGVVHADQGAGLRGDDRDGLAGGEREVAERVAGLDRGALGDEPGDPAAVRAVAKEPEHRAKLVIARQVLDGIHGVLLAAGMVRWAVWT